MFIGDDNNPEQVESEYYYLYEDKHTNEVYTYDYLPYPFYPVVGNHDITHNGWALWSNIFHSSFYQVAVMVISGDDIIAVDHLIFLDSASGTLGREQVKLIEEGILDGQDFEKEFGIKIRNTFIFSHTNIFRPRSVEFASTFPREEMFFLLDRFAKWNANIVFLGHVHKWDEQVVNGIQYLTLDSMCEENNPEPGDYLVRVKCKVDGGVTWEKVHMNTRKR